MAAGRFCNDKLYSQYTSCIVIFECHKVLLFMSNYVLQFSICDISLKLALIVLGIVVAVWGLGEALHWEADS